MPTCLTLEGVRVNALNEAIERYVWAYWWDHTDVKFRKTYLGPDHALVQNSEYLKATFKELQIEKLFIVEPKISVPSTSVKILFAKMKGLGFISGGACGLKSQDHETFLRAFDELYRHGFAYYRAIEKKIDAKSFYEKRLHFFASGLGNQIVEERMNYSGTEELILPKLEIDDVIPSPFLGFRIHRCYFENQPPFVGGKLERLCL